MSEGMLIFIALSSNLLVTTVILAVACVVDPPPQDAIDSVAMFAIVLFFAWPPFLVFQATKFAARRVVARLNHARLCPKCKSLY